MLGWLRSSFSAEAAGAFLEVSTVPSRKLVGHLLYQLADFLRRVRAKGGALYLANGTENNECRLIVDAVALRELPPF